MSTLDHESDTAAPAGRPTRFTLLCWAIAAVILAVAFGLGRHWYRVCRPLQHTYQVLHDSVRSGNTLAEIETLLGPAEPLKDPSLPITILGSHPELSPNGVELNDAFFVYHLPDKGGRVDVFLQFRNGRLINHNPEEYAKLPEPITILSGP